MRIVNIHEAKTQLSKLIQLALDGEEIVISKAGNPLIQLTPYQKLQGDRKPGSLRGKIFIADDFDETSEDIIRAFEGDEE